MSRPGRLRPRSLRSRLVLIAGLLATGAVVLCQLAGLVVLRSWLTDQVDDRLAGFRPPPGMYEDLADGSLSHRAPDVLPSDYRVFFYSPRGDLLKDALGRTSPAGPTLPDRSADLELSDGRPATVPADGGDGADWRVLASSGPGQVRSVVALPLDTVDGATAKLLWFGVGLGTLAAGGVVLLGNAAVRLGLRPLTRVERTAEHITAGDLELNVPVADADTEVGRLGLALNTMLDRLRSALRRAEDSERRMRRFMADAGHELRTPLTAIQGFAELLVDQPGMTGGRRREAHSRIVHNADRMSRLVDDLFLLAKLGHAPVRRRERVDLLSLCADAIAGTAVRHPDRHIGLQPLGGPGTGADSGTGPDHGPGPDHDHDHEEDDGGQDLDVVEALGDGHQLAQILGNLLSNACAHTPAGSRVVVRVGAARAGGETGGTDRPGRVGAGRPMPYGAAVCVVEVADDGPGIAPDDARHVFSRFYRAGPRDPDRAAGSGLGLAIASAIAEAHDGRLELDGRPGGGCVFRLLLPAVG
ncbi:HAMP domain-containing histidine kinase [Streptomyces olivaceus]|uniref:HAMP domain-containing sensor histidine kinase n=1 Tax=Streptomyces olivaceus TaxID=47716 RepID=UPI001CC95734|nr:HAMP domain-containing sensor histidine kinase [Streptomyces olivaceus]MBZ6197761.1 HAMP domain-containing histidine kinase [Streptomyces olivaceus]